MNGYQTADQYPSQGDYGIWYPEESQNQSIHMNYMPLATPLSPQSYLPFDYTVIPQSEIPPGRQSFAPDHSHSVRATFLPKEPMTSGMMNGNRQSYTTVIHPSMAYPDNTEDYRGSYSPVAQGHNSWAVQDRSYLPSSSYESHEVFEDRQSGPVARNNSGSGHRINHPSSGMTSPTSGSWDLASLGPCSSRTRANNFNPELKPFLPPPASSATKRLVLACTFCKGRKIKCSRLDLGGDTEPCRQCQKHDQRCEYPTKSYRGRKKTPKASNQ